MLEGSTYTAGIVTMLIESVDKFPIESIKLYDNNDERQRKVAEACAIIVREKIQKLNLVIQQIQKKHLLILIL